MILIAESGSTKTEWAIIDGNYVIGHEFTEGINPFFQSRRESATVSVWVCRSTFSGSVMKPFTSMEQVVQPLTEKK